MMRTGEIIGLKRTQLEIHSEDGPAVLSLGLTKSGKRQGAAESITLTVHEVCRRLWQWKTSKHLMLTPSASAWRAQFAKCPSTRNFPISPYSLRRGLQPFGSQNTEVSIGYLYRVGGGRHALQELI